MKFKGIESLQVGRTRFNQFLSWWKLELSGMAPGFLGSKPESSRNLLLALFEDDGVTFLRRDSSRWQEIARVRADSTPRETAGRLDSVRGGKRFVVARLPAASILRRRIKLPIAAENELRQILSYQLDTLSPYPPDQVYFSHRVLDRDYAAGNLEVELYLAARNEVDLRVEEMRSWGLVPDCVDFAAGEELADPVVNLLPNSLAPVKRRGFYSVLNKLLLAVNVLLAAALASAVLQNRANAEEELKTRVETAKLRADAAIRLRDKVEKLRAESSFLQDTKEERPSVLALLNELSAILPDGTWLEKAVYRKSEISLSGISSKASVLISEIERSPLFENAAFQASVVQDDRSGGERFQIRAEITGVDPGAE